MGSVAGAIIGPAVGGLFGMGAAGTQASGAQAAASTAAQAQLQGLQFVQQQEAPYNQAGQLALAQYESLLGLPTGPVAYGQPSGVPQGMAQASQGAAPSQTGGSFLPGSNVSLGGRQAPIGRATTGAPSVAPMQQTFTPTGMAGFDISKIPGYQFQLQQGLAGVEGSAAARGGALSGNALQGVMGYGQGLASTEFQNYMSQLAGLANMGQAAAGGVANQGASLLSGAGASLAGGINAASQANAAGMMGLNNNLQSLFANQQFQSALGGFGNQGYSVGSVPDLSTWGQTGSAGF